MTQRNNRRCRWVFGAVGRTWIFTRIRKDVKELYWDICLRCFSVACVKIIEHRNADQEGNAWNCGCVQGPVLQLMEEQSECKCSWENINKPAQKPEKTSLGAEIGRHQSITKLERCQSPRGFKEVAVCRRPEMKPKNSVNNGWMARLCFWC